VAGTVKITVSNSSSIAASRICRRGKAFISRFLPQAVLSGSNILVSAITSQYLLTALCTEEENCDRCHPQKNHYTAYA
jgi:hypothetical protein